MGSKPTDAGTMKSASSGAQAADAALAAQATQNTGYAKQAHDILFGADGKSGNLSKFLDPNSLNVSGPTGAYKLQYNQAVGNIAKQSQDVRGSISRYNANRGFGSNAPAGFTEDQQRRAAEDQVSQQGGAFTDYAGKSYQDALQNFWNSTNIASGAGAAATNAAIAADSSAASNYASLYGNASQPVPSALGGIIGSGLQAGGMAGSAAMSRKGKPPSSSSVLFGGSDPSICWIAEAIYGERDLRTHLVRTWLRDVYSKTPAGRIVIALYVKHGKRVAASVTKWWPLRMIFRPLFDRALSNALAHQQTERQNASVKINNELDFEGIEFQR